jgi:hypothetical protein
MFEERVGDVENVIGELRVAARSMRQQAADLFLGDLGEEPLRCRLDRDEPAGKLGHGEH